MMMMMMVPEYIRQMCKGRAVTVKVSGGKGTKVGEICQQVIEFGAQEVSVRVRAMRAND